MQIRPKTTSSGVSIFATMSKLAKQHNAINLGQGFPNFDCSRQLLALINKHLYSGKNQYAEMPGVLRLREMIARKMNKSYDLSIDPVSEITITTGASQALFCAITAFVGKGDEVMIFDPSFDLYAPAIELNGGIPVRIALNGPEFKIDWNMVRERVSDKLKMIIINTPFNPTGKILASSDFEILASILKDTSIVLISDEVYEHLVFDGKKHITALQIEGLKDRTLSIFSFGKTFHVTGWKVGYAVGPEHLTNAIRNVHQWNVFCVNPFVQNGIADFLEDESHYLQLPAFFQEKRDYMNNLLSDSKLKPIESQGTYYQLYDYSEISDEDDVSFAKRLIKEFGVALIPISVFYENQDQNGLLRLCFAKEKQTLLEAATKLKQL